MTKSVPAPSGLLEGQDPQQLHPWQAVRLLAETKGEAWVNKATILPMIKRLDPTFDPKDHGHASYTEMVKALDGRGIVEVRKGETDHVLRLR